MKKETSFGIIPLKKENDEWWVLLVQLQAGHWGFPKGHPEPNETPQQTATRELKEETNLKIIKHLNIDPISENYTFDDIQKTVIYFPAIVEGDLITNEEIQNSKWVPLNQAEEQITFKESKNICRKISDLISDF